MHAYAHSLPVCSWCVGLVGLQRREFKPACLVSGHPPPGFPSHPPDPTHQPAVSPCFELQCTIWKTIEGDQEVWQYDKRFHTSLEDSLRVPAIDTPPQYQVGRHCGVCNAASHENCNGPPKWAQRAA